MIYVNPNNITSVFVEMEKTDWSMNFHLTDAACLVISKNTKQECVELAEKLGLILID